MPIAPSKTPQAFTSGRRTFCSIVKRLTSKAVPLTSRNREYSSGPPNVSLDIIESLQTSPEVQLARPASSPPPYLPLFRPRLRRPDLPPLATNGAGTAAKVALFQTDASRAKLMEQHVQARVAEELKKLQRLESETLRVAHEKIASQLDGEDATGPSRHTVSKEVEELRHKLQERKQLRTLPDGVRNARGELIRCLCENDRRPLDCWQEVENFKAEVKKLEKGWVEKVIS